MKFIQCIQVTSRSNLEILTKAEIRDAIEHLLEIRDENVWMLFGTLPFYACSDDEKT